MTQLRSDIRWEDIDSKKRTSVERKRLRERGYGHGLDGRAPENNDPEYMVSYRRGKEARSC